MPHPTSAHPTSPHPTSPHPTSIYHRVVAACAIVALTAGTWAAPATAVAGSVAPAPLQYVALGDSYAAGFGAEPTGDACGRTAAAYPALLAREARGGISVRNAACAGATTADVIRQASALSERTQLVTITAGANDLRLGRLLVSCLTRFSVVACRNDQAAVGRRLTTALPGDLNRMLQAVTTAAPNARVVITGYPLPFAHSRQCSGVPVTARLRTRADQVVTGLNRAIAAAAAHHRVRYADVEPGFARHGLCSPKPWLVGLAGLRDNRVLHPTATGQARGYLPAIAGGGLTDRA